MKIPKHQSTNALNILSNFGVNEEDFQGDFGVIAENLRCNFGVISEKLRCIFGDDLNNSQLKILYILICDPESSAEQMSDLIGKTKRSIEYNLQQLKNKEILIRHGADKNGYWEVAKSQFPCENTQENAEQFNLSQK